MEFLFLFWLAVVCLAYFLASQIKIYSGGAIDDNLGKQLADFYDTLKYFVYFKPFNNGSNINDKNTESAENNSELEVCEPKQAINKFATVTTDARNERNEKLIESNYH